MDAHDLGIAARPPLFALILEVSDQFLLLRVHGNDRLFPSLHSANPPTDMSKLVVPVGMTGALPTLLVALKAVPLLVQ
jgi:NCAIR mutase (PurE)-related protein